MAAGGSLSSRPTRMAHNDSFVVISSSPEFPSICDLLPKVTKKTPLRSGSNATPVPSDAPTAFTTAASIWQSSRVQQAEGPNILETVQTRCATSAKPPIPTTIELSPEPPAECGSGEPKRGRGKPRATRASKRSKDVSQPNLQLGREEPVTEAPTEEAPASIKPRRKPRSNKDPAAAQPTLSKGRVTKQVAKGGQAKKKTEIVSKHFAPQIPVPEPVPKFVADPIQNELVVLQPAMIRRLDWTPPRESVPALQPADSSVIEDVSSSAGPVRRHIFSTLQDTYGRKVDDDSHFGDNTSASVSTDVLGKRKLIEMVVPNGDKHETPEPSPTKPKAAKKKPRTITELATAAYRLPENCGASALRPKQDSLPGHLETRGEQAAPVGKGLGAKAKVPRRPTKPKPKPKPAKKKQEASKQPLLSPTSAMRQVAKQDFVFGTASQLATEDDPELLRALHMAMKLSNQDDSDPFPTSSPLNSNLAIRKKQGGGLWAAGARDDDGDLLDLQVLDLTRSSPLPQDLILPKIPNAPREVVTQGPQSCDRICVTIESSDSTLDLSNSPPVAQSKRLLPSLSRPLSQSKLQPEHPAPSNQDREEPTLSTNECNLEPPPSNQEQHQLLLPQSSSLRQQPDIPAPPIFELYSDARLSKEVASFGFKTVKGRAAMIALLGQCWESQNKSGLGTKIFQAAMATSSATSATSPSRPRGRPRKNSTTYGSDVAEAPAPVRRGRTKSTSATDCEDEAVQHETRSRGRPKKDAAVPPAKRSTARATASLKCARLPPSSAAPAPATPRQRKSPAKAVLEIPDSDTDDVFASSPFSSPEKIDDVFSPTAMDLSMTEDTETSLIASPTSQQVALFRYITQAVVSAPRTTDPANPSWHEKMLMYDPIILEDLAAWLNAGQLDRVGYDGEVSPGDVKKWCESKSVCCLWRVNLHGKERKRF